MPDIPVPHPAVATMVRPVTGPAWAMDILKAIKAPITTNNVQNLESWATMEGGVGDPNNPFNAGGQHPGATVCIAQCGQGGTPIYAYSTVSDGVNANVTNLTNGLYAPILTALRQNAPYSTFAAAINGSPWGTHMPGAAPSIPTDVSDPSATTTGNSKTSNSTQICMDLHITSVCIQHTTISKILGGLEMVGGGLLMLAGVFIIVKGAVPKSVGAVVAAASPQARAARAVTGARRTSARERQSTARATGKAQRKAIHEKMANEQSRDRAATLAAERKASQTSPRKRTASQPEPAMGRPAKRPPQSEAERKRLLDKAKDRGDTSPF